LSLQNGQEKNCDPRPISHHFTFGFIPLNRNGHERFQLGKTTQMAMVGRGLLLLPKVLD
jgi:hypothetical protein